MLWTVFISELVGTALLVLLGSGVVATATLTASKGQGGGWLLINLGWGAAVFAGATVAVASGAHLNPAITIGIVASGATEFVPGVPVDAASTMVYLAGQLLGAILGVSATWLAFKRHLDGEPDAAVKLGVFSTGPALRGYGWNFTTEVTATFVLVLVVLSFGKHGSGAGLAALGSLPVALLVVGIGASLGGPTGYAINPARDLGPRIAHAILPIRGKGSSDWAYAWVPVVGPLVGGALGGLAAAAMAHVIA
ncbi:MAG: MIP/aquaporin family protein [Rhodoglobus sp.]